MNQARAWITGHWRTRSATVAYVFLAVVMVIGFVLVARKPDRLFKIGQPVKVTSRVAGIKGPAVFVGSNTLAVFVRLCNTTDAPIIASATISYPRLNNSNDVISAPSNDAAIVVSSQVEAGYHNAAFSGPLDPDLVPGRYRQITQLQISRVGGGASESLAVITEPFRVVPRT